MFFRLILPLLFSALLTEFAHGQQGYSVPLSSVLNYQTYNVSSGIRTNTEPTVETVWSHQISLPSMSSLRIVFDAVNLGPNDLIRISSPLTGEIHLLSVNEAAKWQNHSAFFNGDTLNVELVVAPFSTASISIAGLHVGIPYNMPPELICGTDDRVLAVDSRVARIVDTTGPVPIVCSAFLISPDSCGLTAGHCFFFASFSVAQFNVPPSLANGAIQFPPVSDQFAIDQSSITFALAGTGFDWGIFRLLQNNLGQDAATVNGFFDLASSIPATGSTVEVIGYGIDSGVNNHVLQTDSGPIVGQPANIIQHMVDIQGGNSGGPIINVATGKVIGIHTNGGCGLAIGFNAGTSILNPSLQIMLPLLCDQTPGPLTADFDSKSTPTLVGSPVRFRDESLGVPSSRSWDFDGDGVIDSTAKEPVFSWVNPGTYDVTLTVSNSFGTDSITKIAEVVVIPKIAAKAPYVQDFSSGLPNDGAWNFQSDTFFGQLTSGTFGSVSPGSGGPSLIMDSFNISNESTNEAILHADLAATNGAILKYRYKETDDENDPEDGVFLSDGNSEILLNSHINGPQSWVQYTIDMTAAATTAGMTLTSDMHIIFRQKDGYSIGGNGVLIDDVELIQHDTGQANRPQASLSFTGSVDGNGFGPVLGENGPFFADIPAGAQIQFNFLGNPNSAFQLIVGPLNRNSFISSAGSFDLGLLGWPNFGDVFVVWDGFNPTTLLNAFATTGPAGTQVVQGFIPASFPPMVLGSFQALFSTANGVLLSAATEITIL